MEDDAYEVTISQLESMTFDGAVFSWLAKRQGKDASLYSDLRVDSDYDRGWSTMTPGSGLTCCLQFKYNGAAATHWMDTEEVAEFLNGVWKESQKP